jgi:hypothetical protein
MISGEQKELSYNYVEIAGWTRTKIIAEKQNRE